MEKILSRYCANGSNNGLLLLDFPTGNGKTYSVLQVIRQLLLSGDKRKIFFITGSKKNVNDPYNELLQTLDDSPELKSKVLRVETYSQLVSNNLKRLEDRIPESFKSSSDYKAMSGMVAMKDIREDVELDFINAPDYTFRKQIREALKKEYNSPKKRYDALKKDKKWEWVKELYPTSLIGDYQVFFLTTWKFMLPFDTLIDDKPTRIQDMKIFKGSIVFIDEFDSTKADLLKIIIQSGLNNAINSFSIFNAINTSLKNHNNFPSALIGDNERLERDLKRNIEVFADAEKEYNLGYKYKTKDFEEERWLFSDYDSTHLISEKGLLHTRLNKRRKVNEITLVPKEKLREASLENNLHNALSTVKGAINHFVKFVMVLAIEYKLTKDDSNYLNAQAVNSVLGSMSIPKEEAQYLFEKVIRRLSTGRRKNRKDSTRDDNTFYNTGFCYYKLSDDGNHDFETEIVKYEFEDTPERLLYDLCLKAKVIGISATATYDSVLRNYSLEYLRWKLESQYYAVSQDDRSRIKDAFDSRMDYDAHGIQVHSELIGEANNSETKWTDIFGDSELAEDASNRVRNLTAGNPYHTNRYFRIAKVFANYIDNDVRSFLALLNKFPGKDNDFNNDLMVDLFSLVLIDRDGSLTLGSAKEAVANQLRIIRSSESFDDEKKELQEVLAGGGRQFVISTYSTLGAGQNLQYPIPQNEECDIVRLADFNCDRRDFSGIYLETPTNVIPSKATEEMSRVLKTYYAEFLFENEEISEYAKSNMIKGTYGNDEIKSYKDLRSYRAAVAMIIVQAVGRICRTNAKTKDIYVYADFNLKDSIALDVLSQEDRILNPEMRCLLEKLLSAQKQPETEYVPDAMGIAIARSKRSEKSIKQFLNWNFSKSWTKENITRWQKLRDFVLRHPTLSESQCEQSDFKKHYIKMNAKSYFYLDGEGQSDECEFIKDISASYKPGYAQVSDTEAMLDTLFREIKGLREYFVENNYALSFSDNEYIMSPPLFKNIYKGALGEVVGKYLFEKMGIALEDMPEEKYELFDFKVSGLSVYVDFKYWKSGTRINADDYLAHVVDKAKECGDADHVLIINVRSSDRTECVRSVRDGVKVTELSVLLGDGINPQAITEIKNIR